MPTGRQITLAVLALIAMRIGGIIGSTWAGIGMLGFIVILALLQFLPVFRRFATAVFVLWILLSFGSPMLALAIRADWPILGQTLTRRAIDAELKTAEWFDPVALRARIGLARYCEKVDHLQSEWLNRQLETLLQPMVSASHPTVPLPSAAREQQLYGALKVIEQHRQECRGLILQSAATADIGRKWKFSDPRKAATLAAILLFVAFIATAVLQSTRGKPFIAPVAAAAAVLLLWGWFISAGIDTERTHTVQLGGMESRNIPLGPPGTWVSAGTLKPWRYKIDQRSVHGPLAIRFTDGTEDTLQPGEKKLFGAGRYPPGFEGTGGTVLLWLCPPAIAEACG